MAQAKQPFQPDTFQDLLTSFCRSGAYRQALFAGPWQAKGVDARHSSQRRGLTRAPKNRNQRSQSAFNYEIRRGIEQGSPPRLIILFRGRGKYNLHANGLIGLIAFAEQTP